LNRFEELIAGGVYQYRDGVGVYRCHPANVADKAGVAHIRPWDICADGNHIIGCGDA
jgi:hypothetical protein